MTPPHPLHNRRSIRLPGFDYSQPAEYFVTLHIHQNETPLLFGEIHDGEMSLSAAGQIVAAVWETLPARYPPLTLGPMVVMPDHFHAIIVIENDDDAVVHDEPPVRAIHELPLPVHESPRRDTRRRMTLPLVIGYLKMQTAKQINLLRGTPGIPVWQRNYYEHIIQSEKEAQQIEIYILNNPSNWQVNKKHKDHST